MFFDAALALASLPELGDRTRALLGRLLPGGVTLLLPNPRGRFAPACGDDPRTLGLRVPADGSRWPASARPSCRARRTSTAGRTRGG